MMIRVLLVCLSVALLSSSIVSADHHAGPIMSPVVTVKPAPPTTEPAVSTPAADTHPHDGLDDVWVRVYAAISAILHKPDWDDGSLAPVFIRLAWHTSGTFALGNLTCPGGSNGATMRFAPEKDDEANAGLDLVRKFLEPIKAEFPTISYGDLWTFAGKVAVESMGGPTIHWQPGRVDMDPQEYAKSAEAKAKVPPHGRLPDAHLGSAHLRFIWGRMGFGDREIVALVGAHSVGRCHEERSGFTGPWTLTPTKFNNQFYLNLLTTQWTPKHWPGAMQFEDPTGKLMMLPTDMTFLFDTHFKAIVEEYAHDQTKFFHDFAEAFARLLEFGVPRPGAPATQPQAPILPATVHHSR